MSQTELLAELEKLTNEERLDVIETATRLLKADLSQQSPKSPKEEMDQRFRDAAAMMRVEYLTDKELTAFSVLDSEDFHDA